MTGEFFTHAVVNSIVFSLLGIAILLLIFIIIEKLTPENIYREVVRERNTAVAVVAGALMISLAIIIAAAIHG